MVTSTNGLPEEKLIVPSDELVAPSIGVLSLVDRFELEAVLELSAEAAANGEASLEPFLEDLDEDEDIFGSLKSV